MSAWVPGLFGKLPAHGDFVRRGRAATVTRLDDWLTAQLAQLLAIHSDIGSVLAGLPRWCFMMADGDGRLVGSLCASKDKVGRPFPLVAFVRAEAEANEASSIAHAEAVSHLIAAEQNEISADVLVERLAAVVPADEWSDSGPSAGDLWWHGGFDRMTATPCDGLPTGAAFARLFGLIPA